MAAGVITAGRNPNISYDWLEFLKGWGMVAFYGVVLPHQTEAYEYMEHARDATKSQDATTKRTAQTFTVGTTGDNEDFYVEKIWLDLISNQGSVRVLIEETTAGVPNGTIIGRFATGGAAQISENAGGNPNPEWWEFDINTAGGEIKLGAGTTYALIICQDAAAAVGIGTYSADAYAGGGKYDSINSGVDWTPDAGVDCLFKIYGSIRSPYVLSSTNITSAVIATTRYLEAGEESTQWSELFNVSFMGQINKSAIIQGDAIINFTRTKGADLKALYTTFKLYHIDKAGAETLIGEADGLSGSGTSGVEMEMTRTKISPGEFVKLKCALYYTEENVAANSYATLAHGGSDLVLHLPFKTDL